MNNTLGIDPGARNTALTVTNNHGHILHHETITNPGALLPPPPNYLHEITNTTAALQQKHNTGIHIEGITKPNWHVQKHNKHGAATNPEPLIGTAIVLGAVLNAHPTARLIAPNKHGSKPLGAYPPELVSPKERSNPGWQLRIGTGKLRHERSAYDIATTPTPPRG